MVTGPLLSCEDDELEFEDHDVSVSPTRGSDASIVSELAKGLDACTVSITARGSDASIVSKPDERVRC